MDTQCQVGTVDLEDLQNVGNLDLLSFLLSLGLDSSLSSSVALDGECVVDEDQQAAHSACSDSGNSVAQLGFAQVSQNLRQNHHTDHAADGGTEATGGGQGGTLSVIGSHNTQQGAHTDVHDGVAQLEDDLGDEQNNDAQQAFEHGGQDHQGAHADCQNGNGAQDPGTELIGAGLCLGESEVHESTDQGVVDCVPNVPNDQDSCIDSGVDTQNVTGEAFQIADDHQHANATSIAGAVANHVLGSQLGDRSLGFCHFNFLLKFCLRGHVRPHKFTSTF